MTLLDQRPTDPEVLEPQVLFREARQRRRRLRIIGITIVTVAIVLVAGLAFTFHIVSRSSGPSTSVWAPPRLLGHLHTGVTLVYALNNLQVFDADSGASRVLPLPGPSEPSRDLGMVRVGRSLVLNRGDVAWLYSPGVNGTPIDLGPSEGVLPGPTSHEVWIWTQPCRPATACSNSNAPQMGSVRLINDAGQLIRSGVALPGGAGWYPTGIAGRAGIVLSELPTYGNNEEIWNPLSDQVVRVFSDAYVIGASGYLFVLESSASAHCATACSVQVANVSTGSERTVMVPQGITLTGDAAISPDGSTIAITAAIGGTSHFPYPQAVVVIPRGDGAARVLPGSEQLTNPNLGGMALTWSSNGWLFSSTVKTTTVHVWRPGESQATVLSKLRLPRITHLVNEDPSLTAL